MNSNLVNNRAEYIAWASMKSRCSNPKTRNFANYGGRGISVCARWVDSFADFLADMGPRPDGFSIERENTNGNYEPGNCIWADRIAQNNNRRNNHIVEYRGERLTIGEVIRVSGCSLRYGIVSCRIRLGWGVEAALAEPVLNGEKLRERQRLGAIKGNKARRSPSHCKYGHEFTDENKVWAKKPTGITFSCRACLVIKRAKYAATPTGIEARKRGMEKRRLLRRQTRAESPQSKPQQGERSSI